MEKDKNEKNDIPLCSLSQLPIELLFEIIKKLDYSGINNLSLTCQAMGTVVEAYKYIFKDEYDKEVKREALAKFKELVGWNLYNMEGDYYTITFDNGVFFIEVGDKCCYIHEFDDNKHNFM